MQHLLYGGVSMSATMNVRDSLSHPGSWMFPLLSKIVVGTTNVHQAHRKVCLKVNKAGKAKCGAMMAFVKTFTAIANSDAATVQYMCCFFPSVCFLILAIFKNMVAS